MIRTWLPAIAAVSTVLCAATAEAQPTRDYYSARDQRSVLTRQLDDSQRAYYRQVFAAIDRMDWNGASALLDQQSDGPLHAVARAKIYTAASSPRVELGQIMAWLDRG
ncbi:MAG: lytic transglycosylase domain-containing protein, partial [Croceibacterium sp.]